MQRRVDRFGHRVDIERQPQKGLDAPSLLQRTHHHRGVLGLEHLEVRARGKPLTHLRQLRVEHLGQPLEAQRSPLFGRFAPA